MSFFWLRLLSVAAVGTAALLYPWSRLEPFFVAFLFAHYSLSFYYAKKTVGGLLRTRSVWLPVAVLTVLSAGFFLSGFHILALIPFIGLHIALSDTYMINDKWPATPEWVRARGMLNLARFATGIFIFLLVLHKSPVFAPIPLPVIHTGLAASFVFFVFLAWKNRTLLAAGPARDFIAFEALGVVLAYGIFFAGLNPTAQHFVFYHIVLWTIFPATLFLRKGDRPAFARFAAQTAGLTGFFYWLNLPVHSVPLWASLHFLSSFALSRHNPQLVNRYFYQRIHS